MKNIIILLLFICSFSYGQYTNIRSKERIVYNGDTCDMYFNGDTMIIKSTSNPSLRLKFTLVKMTGLKVDGRADIKTLYVNETQISNSTVWPSTSGIANYSGGNSWGTSIPLSRIDSTWKSGTFQTLKLGTTDDTNKFDANGFRMHNGGNTFIDFQRSGVLGKLIINGTDNAISAKTNEEDGNFGGVFIGNGSGSSGVSGIGSGNFTEDSLIDWVQTQYPSEAQIGGLFWSPTSARAIVSIGGIEQFDYHTKVLWSDRSGNFNAKTVKIDTLYIKNSKLYDSASSIKLNSDFKYHMSHAAGSANDVSSYSIGGTQNIYYKVDPSGFTWREVDYITATGDSITITIPGDYNLFVNLAASTSNASDKLRIKVYKNGAQFSPVLTTWYILSNGSGTVIPTNQHIYYLHGLSAGDKISIRAANLTGSRAISITDFGLIIEKIPEL